MEEKKDVICWASFLDIEDVSTEFSAYFSDSHACTTTLCYEGLSNHGLILLEQQFAYISTREFSSENK